MKQIADILKPVLSQLSARRFVEVSELQGAAKALLLESLRREVQRPFIIITATDEQAATLLDDLRFFDAALPAPAAPPAGTPRPLFSSLPSWGLLPFEPDSPDSTTVGERMHVLYHLLSGTPGCFVLSVAGLMQKLPPWQRFADSVMTLSRDREVEPDRLVSGLVALGYEPAAVVTRIGEFSRRGGIIDIFSPFHDDPVRLDFFGDRIDSLRAFDRETQRSLAPLDRAVILPVRELLLSSEEITGGRELSAPRRNELLSGSGQHLADPADAPLLPPGAEFLAPLWYDMDPLFRYLPEDAVIALIEPDDITAAARTLWERITSGHAEETAQGRSLPAPEGLYLRPAEMVQAMEPYCRITLTLIPSSADAVRMNTRAASTLGLRLTPSLERELRRREGAVAALAENLLARSRTEHLIIVCSADESRDKVKRLFAEYGLALSSDPISAESGTTIPPPALMTGRLSGGFLWPDLGLLAITEEEIFGTKAHPSRSKAPKRSAAAPFLSTFRELKPGDFVVHRDYGVGEYLGLTHIAVDGYETDYLTLRYEPDARLHVPLHGLDAVQKYVGFEGTPPRIDRLGAPRWARTKARIKKDILEMARELIALYAAREALERPPFSPPDTLYREFESSFPFEETADQERAIADVLEDLQRPRPMDRVVCGDVGYGKTEVALRAAFKVAEDGHQVAVLVPTTILADQHFRTFSHRLTPFSLRVEMLSRFRTPPEQQAVLKGLKDGTVDVVIGTHRLLQKDVVFRDLGLLIVDEEHRFGVRHKERIKEFKRLVDVLTLTATPIPRTLHMSLAGLRDLSLIQTPPLDRQSIQVILARFSPRVIREAITRELERGGRVFFVHNRVQGIERMADFIKTLVPAARVGIGHGQMREEEIEEVMSRFISGDLNVLVTTTIIESGIDIPEANTILINRADRFGLAELYQIKGRVGRSREKAFAYLLTPAEEALSDVARKRLRAIQELSELGAGFRIAALDLETRGAGNILGKQQSGHIAAVGIDLYTEMMEEALAEVRGQEPDRRPDTQITLRASAFIPQDYIADMGLRLAAYKQISSAAHESDLDALTEEFRDRYGPPPEPLRNLLEIMKIKLLARQAGVTHVAGGAGAVTITFAEDAHRAPDKVLALLKRSRGTIRLVSEYTLRITTAGDTLAAAAGAIKKCLQELA